MTKGIFVNHATGERIERDLTSEELSAITESDEAKQLRLHDEAKRQRRGAYSSEADPLFFGWQRGENTEQEWLDKVAEIRARHPYA